MAPELGSGTLNASGVATFSTNSLAVGTYTITAVYSGSTSYAGSTSGVLRQEVELLSLLVRGEGVGGRPRVNVYDTQTGALRASFDAFHPRFRGGVRVALGDVNGDDIPDIITAEGPGGRHRVKVFSGIDLSPLTSFFAHDAGFTGGVFVAAGDVNSDGQVDVITGTGKGKPLVNVFSGQDGSLLQSFSAYGPRSRSGVRVAVADINGDG